MQGLAPHRAGQRQQQALRPGGHGVQVLHGHGVPLEIVRRIQLRAAVDDPRAHRVCGVPEGAVVLLEVRCCTTASLAVQRRLALYAEAAMTPVYAIRQRGKRGT